MTPGPWQLAIIAILILLLFGGKGKISGLMGDIGKGLKSFKKGMADDAVVNKPSAPGDDAKVINNNGDETVGSSTDAFARDKDESKNQDKATSG